jgi:hypothetical protein
MYDLALSRRMVTMKFFRVISRVEKLNGEQTYISRTVSVLILISRGGEKSRHSMLKISSGIRHQTAQPEGTLDPAQQSPLASGQQRTRSPDRYIDNKLDPQPRHNPD